LNNNPLLQDLVFFGKTQKTPDILFEVMLIEYVLKNILIHFHEQLSSFLVKLQSAVSKAIDKYKPAQKENISFLLTSYYVRYLLFRNCSEDNEEQLKGFIND